MSPEQLPLARLLPEGGRVLCAVSGGADSMCLLHLLWSRQEELGLTVCAAHYEHGLRGEESLRDAAFVESWCRERGIPFALEHGDVAAFAEREKLGIEDAARRMRYDFLERAATELDCAWILTAHNADDNAETVLLNWIRGAGPLGLAGIPPRRGRILRPLLDCTRREIENYLRRYEVSFVEDSSNAEEDYRRNRIRHQVVPLLREMNPAFAETVRRSGKLLRRDEEFLESLAEGFIQGHYDGESLPVEELNSLHPSVASRVVRKLCKGHLEQQHVETVLKAARNAGLSEQRQDIPGQRLVLCRGRLFFAEPATPEDAGFPEREIAAGQTLDIPETGLQIRAELAVMGEEVYDLFKTLNIKYENIYGKLLCTGRREGDRIRPAGRGCGKGLKALFQEAGLDRYERRRVPLFRDDRGLLAVYGLALDERAAARPGDRVLRLHIIKREAEGEIE